MRPLLVVLALLLAGCAALPGDPGPDAVPGDAAPFAAVCPGATPTWPDPCTALASPNDSPSKTEIDLVVNPKDPSNLVVASKDLDPRASACVWSVAQVSKDAGATWTTSYVGGDSAGRHPLLAPYRCVTDPIMAFDAEGTLYYALQAYAAGLDLDVPVAGDIPLGGGSAFVLARSRDGGATWDRYSVQHLGDGLAVFHDYPRMLVSPTTGAVHTIWNGVGLGGVTPWVSSSRDGGESVDPPVTFWAEGAERGTAFASGFAATSDGALYVTTWTDFGPRRTFHVFESTDDARSFAHVGPALEVCYPPRQGETSEFRTPGFVEMTVDATEGPRKDRLTAMWADSCAGDMDVLVAWSDDRGRTWSDPVRANLDAAGDQFFPRGKVAADGALHVLAYDRRHDPENRLVDAYLYSSTDGGATWTNLRLTATSFDGDLGIHQNGFPFIGDYNGIDVSGNEVLLAWADTRTGRAEIAFARVTPT